MKFGDMAHGQNNNSFHRPTSLNVGEHSNWIDPIFLKMWFLEKERLWDKLVVLQLFCAL